MLRKLFSLKSLGNLLLAVCSVLAVWLIFELFLFDYVLPHLPKGAYHHMVREFRVLGQSSFNGRLPDTGYIALAGDSYAQGKGDWFIDQGYDRNARFHSAHVLQDLTGRDVISYGRSGAGSFEGFAVEPLQIIRRLERHGVRLPSKPDVMLAYFYAGNDIENNLDFLYNRVPEAMKEKATALADKAAASPEARQELIDLIRELQTEEADGTAHKLDEKPIVGNLLLRVLRDTLRNTFTRKYVDVEPIVPPGEVNAARINGTVIPLPDRLQSPPLEVSGQEIARGVAVMQASLALLAEEFPRVMLVYVPSPLACYDLASPDVSTFYGGATLYPAPEVTQRSELLWHLTSKAAAQLGLESIDTRHAIRKAAHSELIHGPRDWDHFNKAGNEALARGILQTLELP